MKEIRAIVGGILAVKHNQDTFYVSHGWWERFRARHRELSLRSGEALSQRRAAAVNPTVINRYFDLLEETIQANGLARRPALIFNCDESGIPLAHRPGKRIAGRGQKHVQVVSSDSKTRVTVLACANASGYAIPPMVIYARANLSQQLTRGEIPGTMYGLSPSSGWIDSELFAEWFERHFLVYAPSGRPLLLLLDGHSSHFSPQFIRSAAEKGVIVFLLPPNTTHVAQPMDSTCFQVLKHRWDEECNSYMSKNPGKVVTIYQFSELFAAAWRTAMSPSNVLSSFRATGVYPVNRSAIEIPGEKKKASTPMAAIAKNNGISYLPLYSPAPRKHHTTVSVLEFTENEVHRFQRRYEEGYDIPGDSRYEAWLEIYHPDNSLSGELFPHSPLGRELHPLGEEVESVNLSQPSSSVSRDPSPSIITEPYPPMNRGRNLQVDTYPDSREPSPPMTNSSPPSSREPSPPVTNSNPPSNRECSPPVKSKLGHFLKVPTPPANLKNVRTKGARVLTSSDYVAEMEEKERIKREKIELKKQKQKMREENAKAKAAERARKAAERAEKAAERAAKASRKAGQMKSTKVPKTGATVSTRGTRGQTGGSARSRPTSGQEAGDVPGRNQEFDF